MANPLRELLVAQLGVTAPPAVLFHYCPPESLIGIIETCRIWATEIRHLNDAQEFVYANSVGRTSVEELAAESTASPVPLEPIVQALRGVHDRVRPLRIYAASFSGAGDLLSQWRAYTPPTGGFALGFDAEAIRLGGSGILLPCVYDKAQQRELHHELIAQTLRIYLSARPAALSDDQHAEVLTRVVRQYEEAFLILAAVFKHPGFSEEQEWRLVVHDNAHSVTVPKFRAGRGGVVPYLPLPFSSRSATPPVQRLVVGPTPHAEISISALRVFFEQAGLPAVELKHSGIPFRAW